MWRTLYVKDRAGIERTFDSMSDLRPRESVGPQIYACRIFFARFFVDLQFSQKSSKKNPARFFGFKICYVILKGSKFPGCGYIILIYANRNF